MAAATFNGVVAYVRRLSDRESQGAGDRQLLDRFALSRDELAFAELVRRHGPMVFATCRRVLCQEQDAEDVFQAAFLVLARKAASIREQSIAGWLYQVTHRLAMRARAAGMRRRSEDTLLDDIATPAYSATNVLRAALDEELACLPEQYRSVLVLCYLEGRTQHEAAGLLVTTADAVNSRLKRARELLRQRLATRGWALTATTLAMALSANASRAAVSPALIDIITRAAGQSAMQGALPTGISALTAYLVQGATMFPSKLNIASAFLLCLGLLGIGALFMPRSAAGDNPVAVVCDDCKSDRVVLPVKKPDGKNKTQASVILLWMNGGPSQIDTFDPKKGNIALFKPMDTKVKGLEISESLPKLAKEAHHLALIRSMTHRSGDHQLATHLMRTGYEKNKGVEFPDVGTILAMELGADRPDLPRHFIMGAPGFRWPGFGPGFLGEAHAAIPVGARADFGIRPLDDANLPLPEVDDFESRSKGKGKAHRKAVTEAFDLTKEKAAVRDAYGRSHFGQSCLLARRLVEAGVPVVEVVLGGWDVHAKAKDAMAERGATLDSGLASLLKDLDERKKLDSTLIVWMGEFGRTAKVNANGGRDHFPAAFSAVLAGCGIKGGQAIGKTSDDGSKVVERPVTPQEFLATVYQAVGVDATKTNRTADGHNIRLVEKGTKAANEALR